MQELRDEFDIDMRVLGIISSERMLLSETAIDLAHWRERFDRCAAPCAGRCPSLARPPYDPCLCAAAHWQQLLSLLSTKT